MTFSIGTQYKIHRVLTVMDGCGMGKGDQVIGNPPINQTTGTPFWTHQATEPCYSWNNVYSPNGHILNFAGGGGAPDNLPARENIEYFNLGGGFPANTTPSQVRSRYTAALNGVDYTGTYIYPHPLTLLPVGTPRAVISDFNGDSSPDYVLQRANSHETAIWYLNNNVLLGGDLGPTLPPNWSLAAANDFDRDSHPDYALFNPVLNLTATALWYLSGPMLSDGAFGPNLPRGWELVGAADFNGDRKPDYLLYNGNTQQTAIFYLSGVTLLGWDFGPTLPPGWSFFGP
jgi:hypothetical protein